MNTTAAGIPARSEEHLPGESKHDVLDALDSPTASGNWELRFLVVLLQPGEFDWAPSPSYQADRKSDCHSLLCDPAGDRLA